MEYDLLESMKENSRNLVITFTKRIYQTAIPTSMTLIYNSRKHEDQILIADTQMKFRIFDKNTFEILATFMGPIYDSYVKQFVSKKEFFNIYFHLWSFKILFSFLFSFLWKNGCYFVSLLLLSILIASHVSLSLLRLFFLEFLFNLICKDILSAFIIRFV